MKKLLVLLVCSGVLFSANSKVDALSKAEIDLAVKLEFVEKQKEQLKKLDHRISKNTKKLKRLAKAVKRAESQIRQDQRTQQEIINNFNLESADFFDEADSN